jgi:hypothetical protein
MNQNEPSGPDGLAQAAAPPYRSPLYPPPAAGAERLKVAVVAPAEVPLWLHRFLEMALASRHIDIRLLLVPASPVPHESAAPADLRAFLRLERSLLRWFLRTFRHLEDGALSQVALENLKDDGLHWQQAAGDAEAVRQRVAALRPDLVLLLGPADWAPALSAVSVHGCWTIDGDLADPIEAGLALLQPIMAGEVATPFGLELVSAQGGRIPLEMSWGATRAVSFSQHRDQAFLKLPALLLRALRRLADGRLQVPAAGNQTLRVAPAVPAYAAGVGLRAFAITLKLLAQWQSRRRSAQQPWFVVLPDAQDSLDLRSPRVAATRSLVAEGGNYWADPFPVEHGQRKLLFVEEFIETSGRGVITCLELQADGTALNLGIILQEPFHLSYPQVFQWRGHWYMTVESCESQRVSLYRTDDFPRGWRQVAHLLEGRVCVDPTLYLHEGHWYLFGNVSESGANPSDELFLFVSRTLEGPYLPHPANPIVSDVRRSRPAGQLFLHEGRLIRPAQCCAPIYGSAVVFNQIGTLSPQEYAETPLSRLDPVWSGALDGCHTYNRAGEIEVLDAHGEPPPASTRIRVLDAAAAMQAPAHLRDAAGT